MKYCIFFEGREIKTDEGGYLIDPNDWSEELALQIAKDENINMTDDHWDVVNFMRKFYLDHGISLMIKTLAEEFRKVYGAEKSTMIRLYNLFPNGPARQGAKIGGIPKPVGAV